MSCITCGTLTDMDVVGRDGVGTTRLRWSEGSLASWPGDGFNPQLDRNESAKKWILGGVGHVRPTSGRTRIGRTPSQHV